MTFFVARLIDCEDASSTACAGGMLLVAPALSGRDQPFCSHLAGRLLRQFTRCWWKRSDWRALFLSTFVRVLTLRADFLCFTQKSAHFSRYLPVGSRICRSKAAKAPLLRRLYRRLWHG